MHVWHVCAHGRQRVARIPRMHYAHALLSSALLLVSRLGSAYREPAGQDDAARPAAASAFLFFPPSTPLQSRGGTVEVGSGLT